MRERESERRAKRKSCKRKEFWKSHGLANHKREKILFSRWIVLSDGNAFNMLEFIFVCSFFYDGYGELISVKGLTVQTTENVQNKTKREKMRRYHKSRKA